MRHWILLVEKFLISIKGNTGIPRLLHGIEICSVVGEGNGQERPVVTVMTVRQPENKYTYEE